MMVRLYEIGEESAGNVEIGFIFFLIKLTLNMTKTEFMLIGSGQRLKEARKGFLGCCSVCETMKDTKEGYFIV